MPEEQASIAASTQVVPLKANAFEVVRGSNSQLLPLFPYLHPGAIVPCSASFESDGTEKTRTGYFLHENTVDEIGFTMGSNGRNRAGDVFVGPRKHGVGFDSPVPFFAMVVITQRQAEDHDQQEVMSYSCEQCNVVLHRHEFNATVGSEGRFPGLSTIVGSYDSVADLNAEGPVICSSCGHVNKEFPLPVWGWENYVRQTRIVEQAWRSMQEAVQ